MEFHLQRRKEVLRVAVLVGPAAILLLHVLGLTYTRSVQA